MTSCFRPSALALIALIAVATSQPSWAQTLAGRPDRYGASASLSPVAATALRSRYLTWPGKVMPTAAPALRAGFTAPSQPRVDDDAWRRPSTVPVDRRGMARVGAAQPLWNPPAVASQLPAPTRSAWAQPPRAEGPALRVAEGQTRQARPSIYDVPEPLDRDLPESTRPSAKPPALRGRDDASPQAHTQSQDQTQAQAQNQARPTLSQARQLAFATPPRARPANGEGVRFYSVHRAFGLRPDPAPIPPQFFAATPDLSDPPGPITNRKVAAGSGLAARNAAQAQDSDAVAQP